MDYRGTCKAPTDAVLANVDRAQVFFPQQCAVHVVTVQAFGAKKREHMFSIDADAGVGMSRFGMAGGAWFGFASGFAPQFFAGCFVVAQNKPFLFAVVVGGGRVASSLGL